MWLRMGQCNAWTQNQRRDPVPRPGIPIGDAGTFRCRCYAARVLVIPREDFGATCPQRLDRGEAGTSQPEHADRAAAETGDLDHPISPELQRREANEGKDHGDNPETDHNGRFAPAKLLEVVMDWRHAEHTLAGGLERD